jgi:hypothetical protein
VRRFIKSFLAKVVSRVLVVTMVVVTCQTTFVRSAHAQRAAIPNWAVVEFVNKSNYGGTAIAAIATDSVIREFQKNGKYEIAPKATVEQQMKELGLAPPLDRLKVMNLGQELNVDAIVAGEINQITISDKGAKQAKVIMSVYVYDSSSGRAVSGATGVTGISTGRVGLTGGEDALVQEAIQLAALEAVAKISSLHIADATILFAGPEKVIMNKGSREGLKVGMEMLILRYGEYVATVKLGEVSGDDATGSILDSAKGVRPGDKARAIFPVTEVKVKGGEVVRGAPRGTKNISGIFTTVLVVGLVLMLLSKGSGGGNSATDSVKAESVNDNTTLGAAVRVSWNTNLFAKNNAGRVEWHIWRSGSVLPVGVANGNLNFFIDDTNSLLTQWHDGRGQPSYPTCADDPGSTDLQEGAVQPGTTYSYSLSLFYKINSADIGGGGGGTATECFFESDQRTADGVATALDRGVLQLPPNQSESVDLRTVSFSWESVLGANAYVVELSTDITFNNRNAIKVVAEVNTAQFGGIVSTTILDLRSLFPNATKLYWRVGAKNLGDNPGPVPDRIGKRYVFSLPFEFTPVEGPPPPPGGK